MTRSVLQLYKMFSEILMSLERTRT